VVRDSDAGPEGPADFAELFGTPDPTEIAPGFLEEVGEPEGETAPPGPPPTTAAADEPVDEPAGGIVTAVGSGGYFTGREFVELEEFRQQVPTDPTRLRAYLEDIVDDNRGFFAVFGVGEPPVENALFNLAWDMLDNKLPGEYRAALFEVLAGIEGVTQTEGTDQLARPAVTVGMPDPTGGVRFELLFDPAGGAYVGERVVLLREDGEFYPGMQPGAVISESLMVETAVVDQIGQRP
jgi:hypothetical protein